MRRCLLHCTHMFVHERNRKLMTTKHQFSLRIWVYCILLFPVVVHDVELPFLSYFPASTDCSAIPVGRVGEPHTHFHAHLRNRLTLLGGAFGDEALELLHAIAAELRDVDLDLLELRLTLAPLDRSLVRSDDAYHAFQLFGRKMVDILKELLLGLVGHLAATAATASTLPTLLPTTIALGALPPARSLFSPHTSAWASPSR
mmetsp:Transcript_10080/g.19715  ORF Transcript_10080/g.19715 Transcript_10080/m.19715 type:complete len:201 (-) Transcript_10080:1931-2533(-)